MSNSNIYDVVWPSGKSTIPIQELAKRLDTLDGKVIAELWSYNFKGDVMFEAFEKELSKRYSGIRFIHWSEFGEIHGKDEAAIMAALPEKLKSFGVDAAIIGVAGGGTGIAADVRCAMVVEQLNIPTCAILMESYLDAGDSIAKGAGLPGLPFTGYPGHSLLSTDEEIYKNVTEIMTDQVIKGFTVQPDQLAAAGIEPDMRDTVFSGTFEEVNKYFMQHEQSDGLPLVPPTLEKVEEFLKFTDRAPGEVLGILQPDYREATIWNIAVNGVMSGCRPEYMPILIAIVEAILVPSFGEEHLGHSPGMEELIMINGKIIKDLDFNYGVGVFRPGAQANTSIGRFYRLYLRNVATYVPGKGDISSFGDSFRNVLAENEDLVQSVGWEPMNTDWGYKAGDNTIVVTSFTEKTQAIQIGAPTAEGVLENIEKRMADNNLFCEYFFRGMRTRPVVILPPNVVRVLSKAGYTRQMVKQHFYENTKIKVNRLGTACLKRYADGIKAGNWPEQLGTEVDYEREIQVVADPDAFQIIVAGDSGRDHVLIGAQNGICGDPVCKEIKLPANWEELLAEAKKR